MNPPSIRGLQIDPAADVALPLLLCLAAGLLGGLASAAIGLIPGVRFLPWAGPMAFGFALESYLFTTLFFQREIDPPGALRYAEVIVMASVAKAAASWRVTEGGLQTLTGGLESPETLAGLLLLGWAWWQGLRAAGLLAPLHPGLLVQLKGHDRIKQNDHGEAYDALRSRLFSQAGLAAAVAGVLNWVSGSTGFWAWTAPTLAAAAVALVAAVAMLTAASLRQQVTWAQEGLTPPPAVLQSWIPQGLALLALPALATLLLPAGPRLPAEWLLGLLSGSPGAPRAVQLTPPATPEPARRPPLFERLEELGETAFVQWPPWLVPLLKGLMAALLAWVLLALLAAAARQLAERLGREDARGFRALLGALGGWYLALWQALMQSLGGAAGRILTGPAQAIGAALGETGFLGRYLPFAGRVPSEPVAAVRHFFQRLQAEAGRHRLRRAPGATASEFGAALAQAAPAERDEIEHFVAVYNEARYGGKAPAAGEVSFARRAWVRIARALGRR